MPKTRILHVVGSMNVGGAETWLMHVLRSLKGTGIEQDFLVHTGLPGAFDAEIRALGGNVLPCLRPARPALYAWRLRRILQSRGRYDVVHSHVHHFSGWVLKVADHLGVPVRIAHSHNDTSQLDNQAPPHRRMYQHLMRHWIRRHATAGLAASSRAAAALFGAQWRTDGRWRTLYCGINLEPFRMPVDAARLRAGFGFPPDAFVVGHVGRFDEQKNHKFLIEIFAEACRSAPRLRLLLVGAGPLQAEIARKASALDVRHKVVFAGLRRDVPRILCGAMDVFLFPSLYEGLPLVLMEAQAAGRPCIVSNVMPPEADAVPALITRLPLSAPAREWAGVLLRQCASGRGAGTGAALALMERSAFNINASVAALKDVYGIA